MVSIVSCNTNKSHKVAGNKYQLIDDLSWVEGRWTNINSETSSFENWLRINDSTLIAYSTTFNKNGDTVFAERMKLYLENDIPKLYVETVGPEPAPVIFTLKEGAEHLFTFENPALGFPSQIVYTQPEPGKIKAWVAGIVEGVPQKQEFYFLKETE